MVQAFYTGFDTWSGVDSYIETSPDAIERFYRATIIYDEAGIIPWEESDCCGVVTKWRDIESKRSYERVLISDRGRALFYDVQATNARAKEQGWGCAKHQHATKGEERACAIEQDYQHLRGFANDAWHYVGVVLSYHQTVEGREIVLDSHSESLWGIESNSGADYLNDTARELLIQAMVSDSAKLAVVSIEEGTK